MADREELRPAPLFEALERHGVRYVAMGSFAAIAQGVALPMTDLDIVPATDQENKERLVACLDELGAEERVGDEKPQPIDELRRYPASLTDSSFRMFSTKYGELDVVLHAAGFPRGYDDLIERVVIVTIQEDAPQSDIVEVPVAHVNDVYESKRQAGRRKDIEALPAFTGIHSEGDPKELLQAKYRAEVTRRAAKGSGGGTAPLDRPTKQPPGATT